MSDPDTAYHETAIQYLGWAVEEIEKAGNQEAARHARAALKCLQEAMPSRDQRPGEPATIGCDASVAGNHLHGTAALNTYRDEFLA